MSVSVANAARAAACSAALGVATVSAGGVDTGAGTVVDGGAAVVLGVGRLVDGVGAVVVDGTVVVVGSATGEGAGSAANARGAPARRQQNDTATTSTRTGRRYERGRLVLPGAEERCRRVTRNSVGVSRLPMTGERIPAYTLGGMCRAATCKRCGKATWKGCGRHVEQVLGGVPKSQRCVCGAATAAAPVTGAGSGAPKTRGFGRWFGREG